MLEGKYQYTNMLMSLIILVDIFQFNYVLVYINDSLAITKRDFYDHLSKIQEVLLWLLAKRIELNNQKIYMRGAKNRLFEIRY